MSTVATPAPVPRRRRRRRTKLQRRQTRLGWLLLVPALAVVAFVAIYPLGKTVYQSFTNQEFLAGLQPTKWVGSANYHQLIHDTIFRDTVVLTIKFTAITVSFEFVLGLIIALGMRLHILSRPHAWISEPSTQLAAVSAVDIWKTTPFVALLLLAGLQVIPNDLYEAASVDGAN